MANFNLVNLTPHSINILNEEGEVVMVPPSGTVARCNETTIAIGEANGFPLYKTTYGEVTGLPEGDGFETLFIVSALPGAAVPYRLAVASPGQLVRGPDGQPIGCRGLVLTR